MRTYSLVAVILTLAASGCRGDATLTATALHGSWHETGGGEHGHVVEFHAKSPKFLVHGPGPGGHDTHDHFAGTYEVVGAEVVLTGAWESNDKREVVRGTLHDGTLRLAFAAKPIEFRRQ